MRISPKRISRPLIQIVGPRSARESPTGGSWRPRPAIRPRGLAGLVGLRVMRYFCSTSWPIPRHKIPRAPITPRPHHDTPACLIHVVPRDPCAHRLYDFFERLSLAFHADQHNTTSHCGDVEFVDDRSFPRVGGAIDAPRVSFQPEAYQHSRRFGIGSHSPAARRSRSKECRAIHDAGDPRLRRTWLARVCAGDFMAPRRYRSSAPERVAGPLERSRIGERAGRRGRGQGRCHDRRRGSAPHHRSRARATAFLDPKTRRRTPSRRGFHVHARSHRRNLPGRAAPKSRPRPVSEFRSRITAPCSWLPAAGDRRRVIVSRADFRRLIGFVSFATLGSTRWPISAFFLRVSKDCRPTFKATSSRLPVRLRRTFPC